MQRAFLSSLGLLLAPLSCAVQSNELFQQEDALATATQPVYYGDGRPGTAVSDTCGRHSAVGRVKRSDQSWCSAVLVRNNIALSAQHCGIVANKATLSFPGTRNPDDFKVIKVTSAPDWHGNVNKPDPEDISVLQLEKAVPRHVAQPLWLLMDPPQSTRNGLTLAEYDNPVMDPEPELCGYGGTRKSDSGDGAGTRRYVPAISLEWSSDYCDKVIGEGPCWTYPYWRNGSELDSPDLNYFASGDSGGALIGYVKGLWHRSYYSTTIRAEAVVPALLGILSGNFQSDFVVEKDNGQMIAATFNNSAAVRNMLAQEVYGVPEAPYESIPGPSLAQLALYGAEWGLQIDDRASVYGLNGGYGDVASNPLGWLGCTATPTSATPDVIDEKYFTILGPDSHVGNVWANDNLSFHDRANVHGTAYAEGDIKVTTQAVVTNVQPHQRLTFLV